MESERVELRDAQDLRGGRDSARDFLRAVHAERAAAAPPASQPELRRAWLRERWDRRQSAEANNYRDALIRWYGADVGKSVKYAEAFEICEYGRQPTADEIRRLFPLPPGDGKQ
ncbi:MAG: hypothetical protein ACO3FE_23575 [Planctomycetaceae bacterium]